MVTPPTITRAILVILSLSTNLVGGSIALEFVLVVWSRISNVGDSEASDGVAKSSPLVTVTVTSSDSDE